MSFFGSVHVKATTLLPIMDVDLQRDVAAGVYGARQRRPLVQRTREGDGSRIQCVIVVSRVVPVRLAHLGASMPVQPPFFNQWRVPVISTVDPGSLANRAGFRQGSRNQLLATSIDQNRRAQEALAIPRVRKSRTSRLRAPQAPANGFLAKSLSESPGRFTSY